MSNVYQIIKEQIRIIDYAPRLGFTVKRKGKYYSLKEHDSVIIDPEKNCFWRNSVPTMGTAIGRGGSIIDFVLEFTNMDLHEVLKVLTQEIGGAEQLSQLPQFEIRSADKKRIFRLPEKDQHMHNVFAYLVKTRKIAPDIVQEMIHRKQLYQDVHKNCVFVGYDHAEKEKPVFACLRGTNTYRSFYGDVPGCDYKQGIYVDNQAAAIYITESMIESLSVMTLKREHWKNFNYLALAGVGKVESIYSYLPDRSIKEIWIGTNNDHGGKLACDRLKKIIGKERPDVQIIVDLPEQENDWNDLLKKKG